MSLPGNWYRTLQNQSKVNRERLVTRSDDGYVGHDPVIAEKSFQVQNPVTNIVASHVMIADVRLPRFSR